MPVQVRTNEQTYRETYRELRNVELVGWLVGWLVIVQATWLEAPRSREMVPSRNTPFRPVELGRVQMRARG